MKRPRSPLPTPRRLPFLPHTHTHTHTHTRTHAHARTHTHTKAAPPHAPETRQAAPSADNCLDGLIAQREAQALSEGYAAADCQTSGGLLIPGPAVAATGGARRLGFGAAPRDAAAAAARVEAASAAEAQRNAGGGGAGGYQVSLRAWGRGFGGGGWPGACCRP